MEDDRGAVCGQRIIEFRLLCQLIAKLDIGQEKFARAHRRQLHAVAIDVFLADIGAQINDVLLFGGNHRQLIFAEETGDGRIDFMVFAADFAGKDHMTAILEAE